MRLIFALIMLLALTGCNPPERHHTQHVADTSSTVHVRQVSNSNNDLLYWYIIYSSIGSSSNSCPCYVASSPSPVSDMSSLNFARSTAVPADATGTAPGDKVVQEETQEVANDQLPEATEAELTQDDQAEAVAEDQAESTGEDVGDGPNDNSMSESNDSTSDSSSGDSGGGDSGGGDSGGGDSGGSE